MSLDVDAAPSSKTRFVPPFATPATAYDLWQIQKLRQELRQEHLDYWVASAKDTGTGRPVDAIICPVAAYAPPPHGMNSSVFLFILIAVQKGLFIHRNADYTTVWNSLDYPALVFPVTAVDPVLDPPKPAHNFLSEEDREIYRLCRKFSSFSWRAVANDGLQILQVHLRMHLSHSKWLAEHKKRRL